MASTNGVTGGRVANRAPDLHVIPRSPSTSTDRAVPIESVDDRLIDLVPVVADAESSEPSQKHQGPVDAPAATHGDGATGVHAITRTTNYWFEREVGQIEAAAHALAVEWAIKGLPRHDVPRTEAFEPEQVLSKRSSQLFREWQQRVSTKFKDAIEDGSQQVASQVGRLRAAVVRLEAVRDEERQCEAEAKRIRAESEKDTGPIRYERLWKSAIGFWIVAVLLATVEFVANFPVFRLLLPMNSVLAKAAEARAANVDDSSMLAGVELLVGELSMHIEAAVVALVAVIVLVVLAKTLGASMRPLFALSAADHPLAAQTIEGQRRQHRAIAGVSGLGVLCVLAFLYFARADIAGVVADRVVAARQELTAAEAERTAAESNPKKITAANKVVAAREETLWILEEQASYAKVVQQNNLPIALLNFALVCTAAVLGFGYKSDDLTEKRGEHPELAPLRERVALLRRESFALAKEAHEASGLAQAGISSVLHLLRTQPLLGWESKVSRLESVIPMFRGENARSRGLDPANVRAFDRAPEVDLPRLEEFVKLEEPSEFPRLRREMEEILVVFARVSPSVTAEQVAA